MHHGLLAALNVYIEEMTPVDVLQLRASCRVARDLVSADDVVVAKFAISRWYWAGGHLSIWRSVWQQCVAPAVPVEVPVPILFLAKVDEQVKSGRLKPSGLATMPRLDQIDEDCVAMQYFDCPPAPSQALGDYSEQDTNYTDAYHASRPCELDNILTEGVKECTEQWITVKNIPKIRIYCSPYRDTAASYPKQQMSPDKWGLT